MQRLDELKLGIVDLPLTLIALGYSIPTLISDKILPLLPCSEGGVRLPKYGVDSLVVYDDLRALHADPVAYRSKVSYVDVTLEEHAVLEPLDWREIRAAAVAKIDEKARKVRSAKRHVLLGREKAVADVLTSSSSYASGHSEVVGSGFGWNEKTNGVSNVNVVEVITGKSELIRSKIGHKANMFWCGAEAWNAIQNNSYVREILFPSNTTVSPTQVKPDAFAAVIGVEKVLIGEAIYSADGENVSDIWKDAAGLAYVEPRPELVDSPTFGFLAIEQFQLGVDQSYGKILTWDPSPFVTNIAYVELYKPWIATNTAGYLWLDTVK